MARLLFIDVIDVCHFSGMSVEVLRLKAKNKRPNIQAKYLSIFFLLLINLTQL